MKSNSINTNSHITLYCFVVDSKSEIMTHYISSENRQVEAFFVLCFAYVLTNKVSAIFEILVSFSEHDIHKSFIISLCIHTSEIDLLEQENFHNTKFWHLNPKRDNTLSRQSSYKSWLQIQKVYQIARMMDFLSKV